MVMPAMIGGFGKLSSKFTTKGIGLLGSHNPYKLNDTFGPYLTGLIEGNGTIIVPDINKNRHAFIRICFATHDKPFVNYLINRLGHGTINVPKTGNYLLLEISTYAGLYHIVE